VVAYDANLRAADRPSTFRTGLANGIGPPWFGICYLAASVFEPPGEALWLKPSASFPREIGTRFDLILSPFLGVAYP
jgi:hypothetical protein